MAGVFSVTLDDKRLRDFAGLLSGIQDGFGIAGQRAINDTLRQIRARTSRNLRQRIALKAKDVNRLMKIERATRNDLRGRLIVRGATRIPLAKFGMKEIKTGISYRIDKSGPRKKIKGAFVRDEGGQPRNAWVRARAGAGGLQTRAQNRVGRLPIFQLFGPSLLVVFRRHIERETIADAGRTLAKRLNFHVEKVFIDRGSGAGRTAEFFRPE